MYIEELQEIKDMLSCEVFCGTACQSFRVKLERLPCDEIEMESLVYSGTIESSSE
jgi:hypothetical protein